MQELSGMMVKKGVDCIMERARKTWKTHKNDAENGHWPADCAKDAKKEENKRN